jgi:hypothetical protein
LSDALPSANIRAFKKCGRSMPKHTRIFSVGAEHFA